MILGKVLAKLPRLRCGILVLRRAFQELRSVDDR